MISTKQYLIQQCEAVGWDGNTKEDLLELLQESDRVYREEIGTHRWWNEYRYTVDVKGRLIGYIYAEANSDESVYELDYEFDPSSVCDMELAEMVITVYRPTRSDY